MAPGKITLVINVSSCFINGLVPSCYPFCTWFMRLENIKKTEDRSNGCYKSVFLIIFWTKGHTQNYYASVYDEAVRNRHKFVR